MFTMRIMFGQIDGNGCLFLNRNRNIEKNDCGLKNRHPDQLFDQISLASMAHKPIKRRITYIQ